MGEKPENDTSDLVFLLTDHSSPSHLVSCSPATRQHSDTVQIIIFSFFWVLVWDSKHPLQSS